MFLEKKPEQDTHLGMNTLSTSWGETTLLLVRRGLFKIYDVILAWCQAEVQYSVNSTKIFWYDKDLYHLSIGDD